MKKFIFLSGLMVMALFFNNCGPSYVSAEPTYIEEARPPRPTNTHIWVDGNWVWNRNAHTYVRRNGYWVVPNRGRAFVPGHWAVKRRGHYWVPGRWR